MADKSFVNVEDLQVYFPGKQGTVKAVDGVSFTIQRGETLGLVGESGCGKSTIGRALLNLNPASGGHVFFDGEPVNGLRGSAMQRMRKRMQMIFQDPYASLNPRMTIGDIIGEPMVIHRLKNRNERKQRVRELLALVGLNPTFAGRYPHEFSGGQRQRVGIARALAADPDFIVCDEAIAALDVSIQAQIINLLQDLQQQFGLTYLFISHDLSVVRHISDRIAVMYLGKIVELTDCDRIYRQPLHPYTQALLSAVPIPDPEADRQRRQIILKGELPSPLNPPEGCRFRDRCPKAAPLCKAREPLLEDFGEEHWAACHYALSPLRPLIPNKLTGS